MFLSIPQPQFDGVSGSYQQLNCGPAVCTELINLCSVDALRIPPKKIRTASGDTSGGIEGGLLAKTVNQLTGYLYPFTYQRFTDWKAVLATLDHSSVGIIINCAKTVRTPYRTNSFTGFHWITIAGGTIKDGTVKYEDPGTTLAGWQRMPLKLLKEASDFAGSHWVLVSPPTEDTDKEATSRVPIRAGPSKDDRVLARLDKGETIHVVKTTKGGPWTRADGTQAHGWHVVEHKGKRAFVKGEGLR